MSTYGLPLDRIDAAYLESLRTNGAPEGRQLEYKEQLPGGDEKAKHEFLADTSSFANSVGGDLIYGVREARDSTDTPLAVPEAIVGLPGMNLDQAQLRLEDLLRQCVDPRIPGLTFHRIPRGSDPPCLLVRIPQSPLRLHMVTLGGVSRFYGRGASGRFQLDVQQIHAAFLEVETAQDRVRRFRLERVARIVAGETPIQMGEGAKLIFHALPLTSLDVWPVFLKIAENPSQLVNLLVPMAGRPDNWRYNLDGFVVHTTRSNQSNQTYIQLFRDGGIEAAGGVLHGDERREGIFGLGIELATIPVLTTTQRLWKLLGVTGPVVLGLALSGVKGWKMLGGPYTVFDPQERIDIDPAVIPEVVIRDENTPADRALKPIFDLAWNVGGWPQSPYYDSSGQRVQPK